MIRVPIRPLLVTLSALLLLPAAACAGGRPAASTDALGDPLPEGALRRLGTVRLRHGDGVIATAFAPDGKWLASVSRDHTVRLWEAATGRPLHQFQERDCDYQAIAFSPDGKTLAASGGDGARGGNTAVRLWDVDSGHEVRRFEGHQQPAHTLAFSPDSRTLLSISSEQVLQWEVSSGKQCARWQHLRSTAALAVAPDRKTFATVGGETEDKSVRIWDAVTGQQRQRLKGHTRAIMALAYAPDGRTLASANPFEPVHLWDLATGKLLRKCVATNGGTALAFAPDGATVASGLMNGTVRLFAVADGRPLRSLRNYRGWVNGLTFSPDGKTLALAGADTQSIHLWDVATGRDLRPAGGHHGHVHAVAFSPDGRLLASGGGDRQDEDTAIRLWDAVAGRELRRLEGHAAKVHCLAFSPDGKTLASGSEKEDFVRVWDASAGTEVRRLRRARGKDGNTADHRVSALAFSPKGELLAAGLNEGALLVWDGAGEERHRLAGHEGRITSVAFSPDGKYLVSGGLDRAVRLWDLAEGREMRQFGRHDDTIRTVAFSPDGRLLVAGSGDWQGAVWLWEVGGREVGRIAIDQTRLYHLAFSPDGRTLAVGCAGQGLRLWEVATRKERRCLPGHPGGVHALAFAPDGKTLASGSADSTVLLWDVSGPDGARAAVRGARLEELWLELGGEDAGRADRAIRALLASPRRAVSFLAGRLVPIPALSPQQLAEVLRDLDHTQFRMRERATTELARLGELAEPLLRRRLGESASPEVRRRVEILLNRLDTDTLSVANLRVLRAFEVLERIGGDEVRRIFEAHAREAAGARLGLEARASLQRLARRVR